ncbi:hypothetical protein NQ318_001728 [Aromia moschata]|uniref:Nicotinate phosphoribosyltransferase n=1 Tax=Aromia moschata TaxID=1265417 RepID=A0AAV8XSM5_9CUCU|nr:hypothetical protein NQ318_001728 [Aromia moschata]
MGSFNPLLTGEFTIFAGLEECLKFLTKFHYSNSDIEYLQQTLPSSIEDEFFEYLRTVSAKDVRLYAMEEGSVAFPRVPLMRIEGPLIIVQLLETTFLTLVNYASLMATNAARYRMAAGGMKLFEFGLRRAQGPDGGCQRRSTPISESECLVPDYDTSEGELAALISFAIAFPDGFMALVDTYEVQRSGLLNFCSVALALNDLGYHAVGIRLDSGDLAYLSNVARHYFTQISTKYNLPWFENLMIMASNDINEETILSLNEQGHKINCFGIGTHLVTCQRQPALGCVYKMVELNGHPSSFFLKDKTQPGSWKVTMPGCKDAYRLYSESGHALIDLLQRSIEPPPNVNEKVLCRHPFEESKRAYVIPSRVEKLLNMYWDQGNICRELPNLQQIKERVQISLKTLRSDIKRNLNPTPFKVAVSDRLYTFLHDLWLKNAPIGELS